MATPAVGTPASNWTFLAVVYDRDAGTVRLFRDTDAATTDEALDIFTGTGAEDGGATETFIGASPVIGGSEFFDGLIDNVFFFDQALSDDDVRAIRDGGAEVLATLCGNGIAGVGEQCDDGNVIAGDGCSDLCEQELPMPKNLYKCQVALLKQSSAVAHKLAGLRQGCLLRQLKGKLGADTVDCQAETTGDVVTDTKIAAALAGLDAKLRAACAGIEPAALGFPGDCPDTGGPPFSTDELVSCLADTHAESARSMVVMEAPLP